MVIHASGCELAVVKYVFHLLLATDFLNCSIYSVSKIYHSIFLEHNLEGQSWHEKVDLQILFATNIECYNGTL